MTDKIQQARRAAFDNWYASRYGEVDRHDTWAMAAMYDALEVFNAALDCVVLDLPPAFEDVHNYACYQGGWNDMRGEAVDAIESTNLGIKVK